MADVSSGLIFLKNKGKSFYYPRKSTDHDFFISIFIIYEYFSYVIASSNTAQNNYLVSLFFNFLSEFLMQNFFLRNVYIVKCDIQFLDAGTDYYFLYL